MFDALAVATNPLVFQVDRAEEFSPVKNARGVDSVESAIRHQTDRAARWLEAAGIEVPRGADGTPDAMIEIAPSFALDAESVKMRSHDLPRLQSGVATYIE